MMKILILLAAVVAVGWLLFGRRNRVGDEGAQPRRGAAPAKPQSMLACAHCGVHVPQGDVVADADGRAYCSEAHRLAGPR
jgi:uncharacterized protein